MLMMMMRYADDVYDDDGYDDEPYYDHSYDDDDDIYIWLVCV